MTGTPLVHVLMVLCPGMIPRGLAIKWKVGLVLLDGGGGIQLHRSLSTLPPNHHSKAYTPSESFLPGVEGIP